MVSVQSCTRRNVPSSPPALPGFGSSGKSFLIDNLLQASTANSHAAHLRRAVSEHPRRTWASEHGLYQCPALSPQQVKDLGGHVLPHSGKMNIYKKIVNLTNNITFNSYFIFFLFSVLYYIK